MPPACQRLDPEHRLRSAAQAAIQLRLEQHFDFVAIERAAQVDGQPFVIGPFLLAPPGDSARRGRRRRRPTPIHDRAGPLTGSGRHRSGRQGETELMTLELDGRGEIAQQGRDRGGAGFARHMGDHRGELEPADARRLEHIERGRAQMVGEAAQDGVAAIPTPGRIERREVDHAQHDQGQVPARLSKTCLQRGLVRQTSQPVGARLSGARASRHSHRYPPDR